MTPFEIRVEILRRKTSMAAIARSLDPPVSRVAVLLVIDRKAVSSRVMHAVAAAIGKDVKYVFSDYFFKKTG